MDNNIKVLINGATAGSNFGDYLFAQMFQDYLKESLGIENVYWYKSHFTFSSFFSKHLNNDKTYKLKNIDGLIYMSGGYFCGDDKTLKDYVFRYLNYFRIGLKCLRKKIPYAIIGMEVAHSKNKIIERIQRKLIKGAKVVVVRNIESYNAVREMGREDVVLTTDSVFAMKKELYKDREIFDEIINCKKRKIFFHINPDSNRNIAIEEKIIPILNDFLSKHKEYAVVISADQYSFEQGEILDNIEKKINCDVIIKNLYIDPIDLCNVIDNCDLIITTKLHVGIVGMKFSKSVISFAGHTEKIQRLYNQVNEQKRTFPLKDLTKEKGLKMMEEFHNTRVCLDKAIIENAEMNFRILNDFLEGIERR